MNTTLTPVRGENPVRSTARVGELDLLRFLAALAVVVYHYAFRGGAGGEHVATAYPPLAGVARYGNLGVELFFMISGFVILMTASSGSLKRFAVSRVARLYPVFWACCTLTFLAILWAGGEQFSATLPQYLVNLTMLSGFVGVPAIDGVYWSLFIELKFYALVALVLLFGQLRRTELLLALWLAASLGLTAFPVAPLRNLLITEYAPLFSAGALYYLVYAHGVTPARLLLLGVAWGTALHNALADIPAFEQKFLTDLSPYVVGGVITGMFGVFMLLALRRTGAVGRRNWAALGALTYPLYLLHQNIGYIVFNLAPPAVNRHLLFWGVLAAALAAAHLLHVGVERRYGLPFRRLLERQAERASHSSLGGYVRALRVRLRPAALTAPRPDQPHKQPHSQPHGQPRLPVETAHPAGLGVPAGRPGTGRARSDDAARPVSSTPPDAVRVRSGSRPPASATTRRSRR